MRPNIQWKKGAFSSTYRIYFGEMQIGSLTQNAFKRTLEGEMNGKRFQFRQKGAFYQETDIIDVERGAVIGTIKYNSWKSRAEIRLEDRMVHWRYENTWQTRWSLEDSLGVRMDFQGRSTGGSVEFNSKDDLLILTGLFITNYFQQTTMVVLMVAVFVPAWVVLFN